MTAELQSLLDAYADALTRFRGLAAALEADDWGRPTDCPGWTVREQVAHVLALERQLSGGPLPPRLTSYPAHVGSPSGEHMENGIAAVADLSTAELVEQLGAAIDKHLGQLRTLELAQDTAVVGTLGNPVPLPRFLPIRVFDVWTHEQDVRLATGRPATVAGPAAEVSVGQIAALLPYVVGKQLAAPAGTSVAVETSGEMALATTVTVGDDGRATASDGAVAGATVTLRMTTETLCRLSCGRLPAATAPVQVSGDADLGRRALAAMVISP
jgi:uncharacterized protein (TIGR03083 family)